MSDEHFPPQHQQHQPGQEHRMDPEPNYIRDDYRGADKLAGRVALITGGDSGIGRAVALHFAREGADCALVYLDEETDAEDTARLVREEGRRCLALRGDVGDPDFCEESVRRTVEALGGLNVLVLNAAEQYDWKRITELENDQLERTFRTNVFSHFYLIKAALPHLEEGDSIISTSSINAFKGNDTLLDYTATKGAVQALVRSFSGALLERGVRVNAVAPGPIWTPLIPASFDAEKVARFGGQVPMNRAGQPCEVAPAYVYLASNDASYITGQTIHVNGGVILNT
ncbi:MAG: SDR family oxidoreductase [Alcanivorax sp.]|nr:SDR family oxidoreductase [Alcanivorax sp.]